VLATLSILPGETIGTLCSVTGVSIPRGCEAGETCPEEEAGTSEEDVIPLSFAFRALLNAVPCLMGPLGLRGMVFTLMSLRDFLFLQP